MKTSFKYFALAAIAILLCSCNKEITPDTIESQVQISAKITPCIVTRVTDDGTAFSDGDAIKVQNVDRESRNLATYTYSSSTGKWSTPDELFWNGESENTFNAWYPADAEYSSFIIPSDQTAGIAFADWMTATTSAKQADGNVELSFSHNLAKVTVVIEKWSNEYAANEKNYYYRIEMSVKKMLNDIACDIEALTGKKVPENLKHLEVLHQKLAFEVALMFY